jgi:uncharacterized protein YodC (DUF2158 family)
MIDKQVDRNKIVVGDIVYVKSGSPRMTVASISRGRANVVYCPFTTNTVMEVRVPLTVLRKQEA